MIQAARRVKLVGMGVCAATVWPALPCFNNLVVFDQLKRVESADPVVGELAGCRRSGSTSTGVALRGSAEGSPGKLTFSGR